MTAPMYGYDCECGCGYQLTPEMAAKGCPQDYPTHCGLPLTPRVERSCRLEEGECARRCASKPEACDVYGEGLVSDGQLTRLAGRRVVEDAGGLRVELDLEPEEPNP